MVFYQKSLYKQKHPPRDPGQFLPFKFWFVNHELVVKILHQGGEIWTWHFMKNSAWNRRSFPFCCFCFHFTMRGLARFVLIPWGVCTCLLFVIHEKNNRKKHSYLTGDVSQIGGHKIKHPLLSGKKQKNILYRKGFEYQPSLFLSNPLFKRPYFLGGNVAGWTVTKIPSAGIPSLLPLRP